MFNGVTQRIANRALNGIRSLVGIFNNDIRRIIDGIQIISRAANQQINPGTADQSVIPRTTVKFIVPGCLGSA